MKSNRFIIPHRYERGFFKIDFVESILRELLFRLYCFIVQPLRYVLLSTEKDCFDAGLFYVMFNFTCK